jgi:hypothetical protein
MYAYVMIGGGDVCGQKHPKASVLVMEKEPDVAILGTQCLTRMFAKNLESVWTETPIANRFAFDLPTDNLLE